MKCVPYFSSVFVTLFWLIKRQSRAPVCLLSELEKKTFVGHGRRTRVPQALSAPPFPAPSKQGHVWVFSPQLQTRSHSAGIQVQVRLSKTHSSLKEKMLLSYWLKVVALTSFLPSGENNRG